MANITRRISGRFGQIWLQNGTTAGSTTTTGNSGAVTVDGISYDAYQVWTVASATYIPMDPNVVPAVTVGGSGLPASYTYEVNYLRGKFIFTPALVATATVTPTALNYPLLYAQGDTSDFNLDVTSEMIDATSQMTTWKHPIQGFREWSGSATIYYKSTDWWNQSPGGNTGDGPIVVRFYPAKTIGTEYWLGAAFLKWGLKVPKGGALEQSVSFQGDGPLIYVAS